ncbi:MAG: M50 family metallopeptidase [Longimicrobiales bacterium]
MKPVTRRRIAFILGFAAYFVAVWFFWSTPVVYPLRIFVVMLHEVSHAAAALATGGHVERIVLTADEGGATYVAGGNAFLILSAGYLGSLGWGLLLLEAARMHKRWLRGIVAVAGIAVIVIALAVVRNLFGFIFSVGFGAALVLAARFLSPGASAGMLTVLGLTSTLYAVLDIRSDVLQRPHLESDAFMLAQLTNVPTLVWGVLWSAAALAASGWALARAYRETTRAGRGVRGRGARARVG